MKRFALFLSVLCVAILMVKFAEEPPDPAPSTKQTSGLTAQTSTVHFPSDFENGLTAFSLSIEASFLNRLLIGEHPPFVEVSFQDKEPAESHTADSKKRANKIAVWLSNRKRKDTTFKRSSYKSQAWTKLGSKYGFELYQGECRAIDRDNNCLYPEVYTSENTAGVKTVAISCNTATCEVAGEFRGRGLTIRILRKRLNGWREIKSTALEFIESLVDPLQPATSIRLPFPALANVSEHMTLQLTENDNAEVRFGKGSVLDARLVYPERSSETDVYTGKKLSFVLYPYNHPRRFVKRFQYNLEKSRPLPNFAGLRASIFEHCKNKGASTNEASDCTPITEFYIKETAENDIWMAECKLIDPHCSVYGQFRGRHFTYHIRRKLLANWEERNNGVLKYLESKTLE